MKQIYLDNAATTKVDEKIAKIVDEFMLKNYGNASSLHSLGRKAKEEIEKAREKIAKSINASADEIIFTSGGTESNNLAIKGLAEANPEKKHIITSKIEHPAVLEVCKEMQKKGYKIDYLSTDKGGIVNLSELKQKITKDTLLVSVMHVNNEIGTIQPVEDIGKICKEKNIVFHSDCVQSFCKIDIDVKNFNLSLASFSGHKVNAPKGIGFIYIRKGLKLKPQMIGGGHENGIRSGTENTSEIVGMAAALDIKREKEKIRKSRDRILQELEKIGGKLNGSRKERIYNNINISFYGIEGEGLLLLLDKKGILCSTGSACSSHKLEASHVLAALGTDPLYIHGSIRITLDLLTKQEEDYVIKSIKESVTKLKEMSPFKEK
jgi:cysteine desulfurase